jgi:CheY-like chemotaxis protein/HPt (histidine-containing phosphotransfer) domain-containing protein
VLLAEDNEVNVYLFGAMLEGEPLTLQVAPNGPAALELLRRQHFDLAFLDVQMPGMDGLRVTRELRALEAASGRARTPVVILTANAFASDVQASHDAGCDRHLAKPFSRDELIRAIVELAASSSGGDAASAPATVTGPAQPTATAPASMTVDAASVLDEVSALQRMGGDEGLYRRLKDHALVFMANWAETFEQARLAGNPDRAHRLAHDLKSIAASVGAYELSDRAAALEHSLRGAGDGRAPDAAAVERTLAALNPVIAALTMPPAQE